jgi:periplasmic divalent cation tolerance protein
MATSGTSELLFVVSTAPNLATAEKVGRALVAERLVACVNVVPGLTSIYRWQGEIQAEEEVLLLMKTQRDRLEALEQRLPELHPYDVPELIALPVAAALGAYGSWVMSETTQDRP